MNLVVNRMLMAVLKCTYQLINCDKCQVTLTVCRQNIRL